MFDVKNFTTQEHKIRQAILTRDHSELRYCLRNYINIQHPKELLQLALQAQDEVAATVLTDFLTSQ